MITPVISRTEYYGLSSDTKPSSKNGDSFTEIDTGKRYLFNEAGSAWIEQAGGGGGGGGGDTKSSDKVGTGQAGYMILKS